MALSTDIGYVALAFVVPRTPVTVTSWPDASPWFALVIAMPRGLALALVTEPCLGPSTTSKKPTVTHTANTLLRLVTLL